jgi:hypothetical protein
LTALPLEATGGDKASGAALRAQAPKLQGPNPQKAAGAAAKPAANAAPADFTGVWYPSTGDTLVVDTTGQKDKTWLGYGGQPHSEQLHVIERIRRPDHDSLMIDITIDDPKTYAMALHTQRKYILKPDWNIAEFVCEDNSINFLEFEKKTRIQK